MHQRGSPALRGAISIALAILVSACEPSAAPAPTTPSAPTTSTPTTSVQTTTTTCPAESAQFDFWVGDWDLAVTDPLGTGVATQHVTKEACVVMEHYKGYFRGKSAYEATSSNRWNPDLRAWQQRYVDASGTGWYTGTFADGTMTLYAGTEGGARANTNRVLWTNITPSGFDWIWQRTLDGGASWSQELSRIRYTRKG